MQLSAAEQDLFGGTGDGGQENGPGPRNARSRRVAAARSAPLCYGHACSRPGARPNRITHACSGDSHRNHIRAGDPARTCAANHARCRGRAPARDEPTGRVKVQLAALPTEQAAKDEWARLQRKLPDLKGHSPSITSADVNGKTWYRLRTGGFADPAAAKTFCDQARGKGLSFDEPRA